MTRVLCALAFVAAATSMRAQEIRRPRLDAKADTNDWEAYYDFGVDNLQRFPSRAYDAFYWAARLAPWSGDPLYAQWVAFPFATCRDSSAISTTIRRSWRRTMSGPPIRW